MRTLEILVVTLIAVPGLVSAEKKAHKSTVLDLRFRNEPVSRSPPVTPDEDSSLRRLTLESGDKHWASLSSVPGLSPPNVQVISKQRSPFALNLYVDLPITFTGFAVTLAPKFMSLPWSPTPNDHILNPASVNALDRMVIGNHSALADTLSDVFLYTNLSLPYLAGLVDVLINKPEDGMSGFLKDSLVMLETLSINMMVTNLVKFSVHRPRPYVYDSSTSISDLTSSDSRLSFFSGHTSMAFSMASAYSYLFTLRHSNSSLVLPVWIGTHLLAAGTAFMRVEAGKHFWSDVMVGAAVGSGIGLLVPYLHHRLQKRGHSLFKGMDFLADVGMYPTFNDGGFAINAIFTW